MTIPPNYRAATDAELLCTPTLDACCEWLRRCEEMQFHLAAQADSWEDTEHYNTRSTVFAEWVRQIRNTMLMAGRVEEGKEENPS